MFKQTKTLVALAAAGLLLAGLPTGCRKKAPASPKVVILGVDGAGWNFMTPLIKAGKLPNFEKLMKGGSSGTLKTLKPTKSSIIWTSIATGKSMVKHGIVDWAYVKKNKIKVPYSQGQRRVKAFWNILGDSGLKVGVINWFVTYPPEEVNGYMLSPGFTAKRSAKATNAPPVTFPADLDKELDFARAESYESVLEKEKIPDFTKGAPKGSLASHFNKFLLDDRAVELAAISLMEKRPVDVFAAYFHLTDVTSHFAVSHVDPKLLEKANAESKAGGVTEATRNEVDEAYSRVLAPVYSYMDRVVGRILEKAGDDADVIIVSDHGFTLGKDGMGYDHTNVPVVPHGIIIVKGPAFKAGYKIKKAHVYDILPTLLHLLDRPTAEDMDGQVLTEAFKDAFLKDRPVKTVKTYEGAGTERKVAPADKNINKKLMEDLRSLGYIK